MWRARRKTPDHTPSDRATLPYAPPALPHLHTPHAHPLLVTGMTAATAAATTTASSSITIVDYYYHCYYDYYDYHYDCHYCREYHTHMPTHMQSPSTAIKPRFPRAESRDTGLDPVKHAERIFNALDVRKVGMLNVHKLKSTLATLAKHEVLHPDFAPLVLGLLRLR